MPPRHAHKNRHREASQQGAARLTWPPAQARPTRKPLLVASNPGRANAQEETDGFLQNREPSSAMGNRACGAFADKPARPARRSRELLFHFQSPLERTMEKRLQDLRYSRLDPATRSMVFPRNVARKNKRPSR